MSNIFTINVVNQSSAMQSIYLFQQPSIYTGGVPVYSNSIAESAVAPYSTTGNVVTFMVNAQYYAGAQQAQSRSPMIGQVSGGNIVVQPISLASSGGSSPPDTTKMNTSPLSLTTPAFTQGVQPGSFRIVTPSYNISEYFNVGSASYVNGRILMSNFVAAEQLQNIDIQPIQKYYIAIGSFMPGTVIYFTASSVGAAMCDFSHGYATANVTLNSNGSWSVSMS
ncbi:MULTISPECIES: hypothetical protein [unclassified Azospirillum]|uniref:hypothetical protein n=1 Tax=unclassified Azospirillum TaxID=2630922 RepID=UPI000B677A82|nr:MULTISPECIES: hypothetical protein [unclassified Azospirillum]SNS44431.1 hypothetical protein SAMN05880556_1058 [Azospirillum sp. RU38E]SNS63313.1 hypothetical protein SAMN05880591_1058 [Azospirillum sp. RU37A]